MTPQTRSTAKPSPGRLTRNSVYGRPPPSPSKPRKSSANDVPAHVQAHDGEGKVASNVNDAEDNTSWISCRDPYGAMTTVAMSETGEGIHVRWYYVGEDMEVDADEEADVELALISVDETEERGVTPVTARPSHAVRNPFPQTPMAPLPYDAGSVIRTPVKKTKPLGPSPTRIGDRGVRCLYVKGGVLRELNGGARIVLRHPVGSTANLSREQVERLEKEQEERIFRVQVEKLLAQKRRIEEEEEDFSDSAYDEMETLPSVSASMEDVENASNYLKGPNGELLDRHGRQMYGREGTVLIHSDAPASPRRIQREEAFVISTNQPRFGPEGTELIID